MRSSANRVAGMNAPQRQRQQRFVRLLGRLFLLCIATIMWQASTPVVATLSCALGSKGFYQCFTDGFRDCSDVGSVYSCSCFCTAFDSHRNCTAYSPTAIYCSCPAAYTGNLCELTYCTTGRDCNNRAYSVSGIRQAANCVCSCLAEWTGSTCAISNVCTNANCNNQSVSVSGNRPNCSCTCQPEWTGSACETSNVCTNDDCNYRAINVVGNRPNCYCTCVPEWIGGKCEISNMCTSSDCGARITSFSGNRPFCICVCQSGWGSSPSCSCNQTKYCDAPGTVVVAGTAPQCGCICRKGFAGPRCQRTSSITLTLNLSESDEATPSGSRNRKLSATLSASVTLDPASTTHTVTPFFSTTQSASLGGLSATRSATDTFTFSRQRNSWTASVSFSTSQSESITSSRTPSSSLSHIRSPSSTRSATDTASHSLTGSLPWSSTHSTSTTITLSVTTTTSTSTTSTVSTTASGSCCLLER